MIINRIVSYLGNLKATPGRLRSRPMVASLAALGITAIIFSLPLLSSTVEATERYYVTEITYQPYTATAADEVLKPDQISETVVDGFYKVVPSGIVVPFRIEKAEARVVGSFENSIPGSFLIYSSPGRIIWEMRGSKGDIDVYLQPGSYRAKFQESLMWGEDLYLRLSVVSPTEAAGANVGNTQYRAVPTLVEKQRTTVKENRLSVWQLIFR